MSVITCRGRLGRLMLPAMLAVAVLVLGSTLTGVARAQGPGVAAGFEIDGNLMSDAAGQRDWFTGSAGAGVLLGSPNCGQQNPLYAPAFFRRDGVSLADTTIGSGKNNSDLSPGSPQAWTIHTGSSVSDKANITEVFANSHRDPVTGHIWIYLGAARLANNGASNVDFEFNKAGVAIQNVGGQMRAVGFGPANGRTVGDVSINIQYINGGATPVASVLRWGGTDWVVDNSVPAGTVFTATNATSSIPSPCPVTNTSGDTLATAYDQQQFVEVALDITGISIGPDQLCGGQMTMSVKTRQSPEFTSNLSDIALFKFSVIQPPQLSVSHTDVSCFGQSNGSIDLTVGGDGPFQYFWSGPNGFSSNSQDPTGLAAGTYNLTITDGLGCDNELSVVIQQPPAIGLSLSKTDPSCVAANGGITASGSGSLTFSIGGPFQASGTFAGLPAGTFTVTAKDAGGCTTSQDITLLAPSGLGLAVGKTDPSCAETADGTITANGSGGSGALSYSIGGAFQASGSFTGLAAGTYTVTVKDANGCTFSKHVTVQAPPALVLGVDKADPKCADGADGSITASGSGGSGVLGYSIGGAFQASGSFTGLAAGTYAVTVKDANGCNTTQSVTLTSPPALTLGVSGSNPLCSGSANGSITATGSGGTGALAYSKDNATFQASGTFAGLAAGNYTIWVKDANGCKTSKPYALVNPAALTLSVGGTNPLCNGGATGNITAVGGGTGALTYSKDNATFQASGTFANLAAGNYTIWVKDANGCQTSKPYSLVNPAAISLAVRSTPPGCNSTAGSISVTASGGTGALQYSIDGGGTFQNSGTFANLSAGTYNLVVKDANSCQATWQPITFVPPSCSGHILPTATTCADYYPVLKVSDLTQLCYNLDKTKKINNVAPGVFFYYSQFTASPSLISGSSLTVTIRQTVSQPGYKLFMPQQDQLLFYDASCNRIQPVTVRSYPTGDSIKVVINPATPNATYILSVKYNSSTVTGLTPPSGKTATYHFATCVGNIVVGSEQLGLQLTQCKLAQASIGPEPIRLLTPGDNLELYQAVPNPFRGDTRLSYAVNDPGVHVEIGVFDLVGRRVTRLLSADQDPGVYSVTWDGTEDRGMRARGGMYFIHVSIGGQLKTVRVAYLN